jgi:hypothetical protein
MKTYRVMQGSVPVGTLTIDAAFKAGILEIGGAKYPVTLVGANSKSTPRGLTQSEADDDNLSGLENANPFAMGDK